jgi:hypothetical protein
MTKNRKEIAVSLLLVFCLLLTGLLVLELVAFTHPSFDDTDFSQLAGQTETSKEHLDKSLATQRERVELLKASNAFVPPPPKPSPPGVTGIFGREAFMNGKWVKVGDSVGPAKVLEIHVDRVIIEWEGKNKTLWLGTPKPESPPPKEQKAPDAPATATPTVEQNVAEVVAEQASASDLPDWLANLPEETRRKLLEFLDGLSPERRARMLERLNDMPAERRERRIERIVSGEGPPMRRGRRPGRGGRQ